MPMPEPATNNGALAFKEKVCGWAGRLRVRPHQVRVQEMSRKWASCSTVGWITFARDLLDEPSGFQDYVIVHELLHLRYRNHGKLFRAALRSHLAASRISDFDESGVRCLARGNSPR